MLGLRSLRHYSATELVAAGVDLRTVAGRLGHGSGGATTLKVYAGWVDEADRRAVTTIASIMPKPVPRFICADPAILRDLNAKARTGERQTNCRTAGPWHASSYRRSSRY